MAIFHLPSNPKKNVRHFHCNDIKADHFVASDELFFSNATASAAAVVFL